MTVTAPPRPPRPGHPVDRNELEALVNALIEEARRRARRRRRIYAAVVASAAVVGVFVFAIFDRVAQSQSTSPGIGARSGLAPGSTRSRIAFMTTSLFLTPGKNTPDLVRSDLYVMNADGSGKRKLTRTAWGFSPPAWSPDGQKIAFDERLDPRRWGGQCGEACNVDIYVVNADGSGRRNLTRNAGYDAGGVWSPDGQKIAYVGTRGKGPGPWGKADIYVMNADGSDQRRLTDNPQKDDHPVWSPVGGQIAFTSWHGRTWDVWVVNAGGSDLRNLTRNRSQDYFPAWSPDGQTIASVRTRNSSRLHGFDWEIWATKADGSGQRRLMRTARDLFPSPPVWSPDGRRLLFVVSDRDGNNAEIDVMNSDGSGRHRLARIGNSRLTVGHFPAWSPDSRQIAFISARVGLPAIWLINADGSEQRNLTPGVRGLQSFAWSTTGRGRS